jgi:4'-phosphopantetheinyl transferase
MPLLNHHIVSEQCSWGIWHLAESEEELLSLLPKSMIKRELDTIQHTQRKIEWLGARALLAELLRKQNPHFEKVSKENWLTKDDCGKPQLHLLEGHISIAHCKGLAVAMVHKTSPCGIDIEQISPKIQRVTHRVCSESEMDWAGESIDRLSTLWCAKEALYKYYGKKKLDFKNEIQLIENQENNILVGNIAKDERQWQAQVFTATFENFKVAYCF